MSVVFSLTAVGIAMGVTALSGAAAVISAFSEHKCGEKEIEPIETRFSDRVLLVDTLRAHGFETVENSNEVLVKTNVGSLQFFFSEESGSYWVRAYDLVDESELAAELAQVNAEYLQGVQRRNYQTLKASISERDDVEVLSEEILDDDTIVITLGV